MISLKLFQKLKPGVLNLVWRVREVIFRKVTVDMYMMSGNTEGSNPSRSDGIAKALRKEESGSFADVAGI